MPTLKTLLTLGTETLKQSGIEQARHEARLLLEKASALSRLDMVSAPEKELSEEVVVVYQSLLKRRAEERLPISRLVGEREFWSLPFVLSPATLDPRSDSEILIESVLNYLSKQNHEKSKTKKVPLRLLDLGTGSGCLLITLLTEIPEAQGLGVDLSSDALVTARLNAQRLGVGQRARFVQMNWGEELQGSFDVIISNPPYIPEKDVESLAPEVRCHDPKTALTAGPEGLEAYRILAPQIAKLLNREGVCAIEIGQGQHDAVQELFENAGLKTIAWYQDLAGIKRCGLFRHTS